VYVVLLVAKQREANESLVAVNTVLEVSRRVVSESKTLQSNLETIEADALTALQRASQQYSAVLAFNQVNSLVHLWLLITCCLAIQFASAYPFVCLFAP